MKKIEYGKTSALGIFLIFLSLSIAPCVSANSVSDNFEPELYTIELVQDFSKPVIRENGEYAEIIVEEANSFTIYEKMPMLPRYSKTYEFPLGTKLENLEVTISEIKTMNIDKPVKLVPSNQRLGRDESVYEEETNQRTVDSFDYFPNEWFSYSTGAGLNENNEHVIFLSLNLYPVRYIPFENSLQYVGQINAKIVFEEREKKPTGTDLYDFVIITPSEFSDDLQPLVDHKNSYGIETNLVTLDSIYGQYPGRDDAEQIKYFIKHALDEWNVSYVLLVGDINKLPTRIAYSAEWGEGFVLSDLYFADIYDENESFCSWDGNNNSKFGEVYYTQHEVYDLDDVDLYADVHLGRLACRNPSEVSIVVDKIINYETSTYGEEWFSRLVLCGGDTFPSHNGLEGETTNDVIAGYMPDFTPIRLWTSTGTFNWINVNREVNEGAGFLEYSGHGFEIGMSTHPPDDEKWIRYRNRHLLGLFNRYKLPIVFFDACLTSTLDFDINGAISYALGMNLDLSGPFASKLVPTYSWNWVKIRMGGAIATIGATRSAYTNVNEHGVFGGAGLLSVNFFRAYEDGITVSQMLTQSQTDYINEAWKDFFTIEEFILLGDPTLRVGGYPSD